MENKRSPRIEGYMITLEDLDNLEQCTKRSSLSERDRNIIEDRFALRYGPPLTYKQVAEKNNISIERVGQIVRLAQRRIEIFNREKAEKDNCVPTLVVTLKGQGIKDFHRLMMIAHDSITAEEEPESESVFDLVDRLFKESDVDIYNPVMTEWRGK